MHDHIAVGVVGCGYWGKNLVRNFHQLGSLRVICDVDRARSNNCSSSTRAWTFVSPTTKCCSAQTSRAW